MVFSLKKESYFDWKVSFYSILLFGCFVTGNSHKRNRLKDEILGKFTSIQIN